MSHIPSSAMPHAHTHEETGEPASPATAAEPAAVEKPVEAPAAEPSAAPVIPVAPHREETPPRDLRAIGGWLALGAGVTAAVTAAVLHFRGVQETPPAKRKRRHKKG